jgi:hypothetical protein
MQVLTKKDGFVVSFDVACCGFCHKIETPNVGIFPIVLAAIEVPKVGTCRRHHKPNLTGRPNNFMNFQKLSGGQKIKIVVH